jgi:REG-2-like HAD superfamily hydrolase
MHGFVADSGHALLLDVAGTLLHPVESVAQVYARQAGVDLARVGAGISAAMEELRPLRAHDPGWRAYWSAVVARATGSDDPAVFEALYSLYARADAWAIASGAESLIGELRECGMKVGLVSNWDARLRPLLDELGVLRWIDLAVVSAEEGIEKPAPEIFAIACSRLGVAPQRALMVGDSPASDVAGARAAGLLALHYGTDVTDFAHLRRLLLG